MKRFDILFIIFAWVNYAAGKRGILTGIIMICAALYMLVNTIPELVDQIKKQQER